MKKKTDYTLIAAIAVIVILLLLLLKSCNSGSSTSNYYTITNEAAPTTTPAAAAEEEDDGFIAFVSDIFTVDPPVYVPTLPGPQNAENPDCTDTDAGIVMPWTVPGTCRDAYGPHDDTCVFGSRTPQLTEYTCSRDNICRATTYDCTSCISGVCYATLA